MNPSKIWSAALAVGLAYLASGGARADACEFEVLKTSLPFRGSTLQKNLCLEAYFSERDIGRFSLEEDERDSNSVIIFRDSAGIRFDDMLLFSSPAGAASLGESGRKIIIRKFYAAFLASLKSDFGSCRLEMSGSGRSLSVDNFIVSSRNEAGQPGTRLMLTRDDVPDSAWKLICADGKGAEKIEKQGTYFFVFLDVYEPIDSKFKGNLAKFLFSFH